jgi:hypothetical protein
MKVRHDDGNGSLQRLVREVGNAARKHKKYAYVF